MDYQRLHPEKFQYSRSHFYTMMFLDEYENRAEPNKNMNTMREEAVNEWFSSWDALIVSKSRKGEIKETLETTESAGMVTFSLSKLRLPLAIFMLSPHKHQEIIYR
jgi:hypothetical protein